MDGIANDTTIREADKALTAAEAVIQQLRDLVGDDAEADLIRDTIEGETNLIETITAVVKQIGEDEARAAGLKTYIADITARRKRYEARADTFRAFLATAIELVGTRKKPTDPLRLELPVATITQKAVPPSLVISEESEIPAKFWKPQDPVLDRKELLDELKARKAVADARAQMTPDEIAEAGPLPDPIPGASLSNGGQTVQIRVL